MTLIDIFPTISAAAHVSEHISFDQLMQGHTPWLSSVIH